MGLVHLAVDVRRDRGGSAATRRSSAPASKPVTRDADESLREVDDQALTAVVRRALRNYLAGDGDQLVADLAPGVVVGLPAHSLRMTGLESLKWSPEGGSVVAVVTARTHDEVWTLRYELDVIPVAGRWEIGPIETRSGY
jgi:hypothetical protein